jgi:DUF4097 and DUF4098 domain-containing protein YvlB
MVRRFLLHLATGVFLLSLLTISVAAQDFEKTYTFSSDAIINIHNISGNIEVRGTSGTLVKAMGYKEGRDKEKVAVVETATSGRLDLKVNYPPNCNCDASIRFVVEVPASIPFSFDSLSTVSGDILVEGVKGKFIFKTVSGDLTVHRLEGPVELTTTSGDVKIETMGSNPITAKSVSGDLDIFALGKPVGMSLVFSSTSGDIVLHAPSGLDAEVEMHTVSGDFQSDFPMTLNGGKLGTPKNITARLGNGGTKIQIRTVSGDVSLKKS